MSNMEFDCLQNHGVNAFMNNPHEPWANAFMNSSQEPNQNHELITFHAEQRTLYITSIVVKQTYILEAESITRTLIQ